MSCCGKGRMQASRESVSRGMARPRSADRAEPRRRRIARLQPLSIPLKFWAPGLVALAVWGWCLWAIMKALSR